MNSLQTLLESSNPWKSQQSEAARLAKKWEKTGLLKDMENVDRNNLSMLLENQAKQLLTENNLTSGGTATFTAGTGENWAGIALPLIRKVFGQIVSKEFVSVQPMNMPSGLVFYLDFQYGNSKTPFTVGGSLYGRRSATGQFPFSTTAPDGGVYGAGRFAFSTNQFSSSGVSVAITSASYAEVNFDSALSASMAAGEIKKLTLLSASASTLPNMDKEGIRAFIPVSGSYVNAATVLQALTTYDNTLDALYFFVTGSTSNLPVAGTGSYAVYYNKSTKDNNRGDFESSSSYAVPNSLGGSSDIAIPEINIKLQSEAIVAKTKKLKAVWTPEFTQDLNAYQNIDAEAELTSMLSQYISLEVDAEILDMLIVDAASEDAWSAVNNTALNSAGTAFTALSSGYYNSQGQWFQTLGTKITKMSNNIHQLTLRGGANFLVTSPKVATIIESIPGFASNSDGDAAKMKYAFGVQKSGMLNGQYTIYKNPYMTENLILMGFRGSQYLETGAVYAPYVPLIMTPLVYDPDTFVPRKGLLTRYAKKMLRPEFYARLYVEGLNTI